MLSRARSADGASLLSQIVSSVSNFALLALVARATGPADYAVFAGALAGWFLVLGVSRALVVEPMVLRAASDPGALRRGHRGGRRLALAAGAVVAAATLAGWALGAPSHVLRAGAALAVAVVALAAQDTVRWHFLSQRRGGPALLGEVVVAAVELGAAAALLAAGRLTVVTGLLSVGAGAAASAVVLRRAMVLPAEQSPAPEDGLPGWLLVDFLCTWLNNQASLFVVALLVAAAEAGILRAVVDLFGPLRVVQLSLLALLLPAGAAAAAGKDGPRRLLATLRRAGTPALTASAAYCLVAVAVGATVVAVVYGDEFRPPLSVVVLLAVGTMMQTVQSLQLIALKSLQEARALARFRLATTPPGLLLMVVLTVVDGVRGAALAVAVAHALRVAVLVVVLARLLRAATAAAAPDSQETAGARAAAPRTSGPGH